MKRRVVVIGVAVVVAAIALGVWTRAQTSTGFAMGSVLTQTWWRLDCADLVFENIQQLEQELLNATEAPERALEIMEASGGAYNPYLGALTKLWDIDGQARVPTQEEIDEALQKKELDLGAYGKGAACDAANLWYITFGLIERPCGAVINLGGNILTYSHKPWFQPFKIALRDPKGGPNDTMGMFRLRGTNFISTSGSYEKFFEQDGKRYHHIFDPKTGYPAEREPGLISVTVINGDKQLNTIGGGALGDMISTACFVLGFEASRDLLAKYACDAIFVYEDGAVRAAGGVREYFRLDNSKYHWGEA